MRRTLHVAILAIATLTPRAGAQAPRPQATFRGGTDLVQVDVAVLDRQRRPVRGLTAADFTIAEDGQPREIQAFTEVHLPDRVHTRDAPWTRDVGSDVATNQAAHEDGRLVIILLDRTIPVGEPTLTAKRIAAAAIDQLGPGDLAAVVSTGNGGTQNLTSDRARLLRAINESDLSTDISEEAKGIEAGIFALTGRIWNTLNDGRCQCGLCVLETITQVANAVQGTPRRKVLLFIGNDLLLQVADTPDPRQHIGCEARLRDTSRAMFTAVDRANLTIHSLDPAGLVNVSPATRASSPLRGNRVSAAATTATTEHLKRQGNLEVLPHRTGGRTVLNTNGPDLAVPGIFRESESYYLIGFRPGGPGAGGAAETFHRITVKTTRRGLDVRARSGYVTAAAAPGRPAGVRAMPEAAATALTGLLPDATAPVDMHAAAFAVPGTSKAAVVFTVGVGAFAPEPAAAPGTTRNGPLELVAAAFDRGGRPKGLGRQSLELSWPAGIASGEPRFDALSRLDLAPGDYELRLGVSGAARTSSVFSYLTVPDFAAAPLSLSNIVVGATAGTLIAPRDFLAALLPVIPTARREFARGDGLVAFLRIYQGTGRRDALSPVQLQSSIVDASGAVVAGETRTLEAARFGAGRTADQYFTLPLATLAPGDYLLEVKTAMGGRAAQRAVRFTVR